MESSEFSLIVLVQNYGMHVYAANPRKMQLMAHALATNGQKKP